MRFLSSLSNSARSRYLVPGTLVLFSFAACFLEPHSPLNGQWGGRAVVLYGHDSQVELEFPCMKAVLPEPSVDGTGHFSGAALITFVSGHGAQDPAFWHLEVSGQVRGDDLTLTVTDVCSKCTAPQPEVYTLRRGTQPDFSDFGCLL